MGLGNWLAGKPLEVGRAKARGDYLARHVRSKKEEAFLLQREAKFQDEDLKISEKVTELRKQVKEWYETNEGNILPASISTRYPIDPVDPPQ